MNPCKVQRRRNRPRGGSAAGGGAGEQRKEFLVGASPFLINGESLKPQTPPKTPGADTDAVLAELGYSVAEVAVLKGSNAV